MYNLKLFMILKWVVLNIPSSVTRAEKYFMSAYEFILDSDGILYCMMCQV